MQYIVILFYFYLIVGIGLQLFPLTSYRTTGQMASGGFGKLYQSTTKPTRIFGAVLVIIAVIGSHFANFDTHFYYEFLILKISVSGFISICLSAFIGFFSVVPIKHIHGKGFLWFLRVVAIFILIFTFFVAIPQISEDLKGLISGPQIGTGIVQEKYHDAAVGNVPVGYVKINDNFFRTYNYDWYNGLQADQSIQYAYNPYATYWRPAIFSTNYTGISTLGFITIVGNLFTWSVTLFLATDGWLASFGKQTSN